MIRQTLLFFSVFVLQSNMWAQHNYAPFQIVTSDFCKKYDLSNLITTAEETGTNGVFDSIYQRIQFHFQTVAKDAKQPELYHVTGASRKNKVVTPFAGIITFTKIKQYDRAFLWVMDTLFEPPSDSAFFDPKSFLYTYCVAKYAFKDDKGVFMGKFEFGVHQDLDGNILDDLDKYQPDGYSNYIFKGVWVETSTEKEIPCSWGDGRLPVPEGVDVGIDAFQIARLYRKYGWQMNARGELLDNPVNWWK
jgi:hypothetical protein